MAEMLDQRVNPWLDLPVSPPYVLPEDLAVLRRYPRALASLVFAGPPGPFIGNPSSARVILLSLNPGFDEGDIDAASNEAIRLPWLDALTLREDAIFHPIHPDQARVGGSPWWPRKLRALTDVLGVNAVMTGLACVEWFPYASRKFVPIDDRLPSQQFTFELVGSALARGAEVIIMRSRALWIRSVPGLADQHVITLINNQNPAISPGNMKPSEWKRVLAAL